MDRQFAAARLYHQEREARRFAEREVLRQEWQERVVTAVQEIASRLPDIEAVYLFGSLAHPGRFGPHSDIDLAIQCCNLETESRFWRALEARLARDVDLRPLEGAISDSVTLHEEKIYARKSTSS
jgi:predicted nucleotidyltransferase